jgi:outer membrane protein OmpA-like peptidoglycan-associated protein
MIETAAINGKVNAYVYDLAGSAPTCVELTPTRSDGQVVHQKQEQDRKWKQNRATLINTLSAVKPSTSDFDLLELMSKAVKTADTGNIIVVSSGVTTTGGMDLRQVGWSENPTTLTAQLTTNKLLPNLSGWSVEFTGLGLTTGTQPTLRQPQRLALSAYWRAVCAAGHARKCTVNDEPRTLAPSHSMLAVPVVPVPEVLSVVGPDDTVVTTVPTDALGFTADSAVLGASADDVLRPLAQQAADKHRPVIITGYSVAIHGQLSTTDLSQARARAVANALVRLGLPANQLRAVTGVGASTDPPNAAYTNGKFDESKAAKLRRVIIQQLPTTTK